MLLQLLANGLVAGCVYALVALGFGIIYNTTQIFHFAHGVVYTVAAYLLYTSLVLLHWPTVLGFIFALIFAALLGIVMERYIYYPLYKKEAPLLIAMISSLGIYIFLVNLIAMLFGNETKVLRPGIEKTYQLGFVILTRIQIWELLAFLIVFPLFYLFMTKTKLGKTIRALSNNPNLVTVIGVDIRKVRLFVFGIGSALAAIGASLVALDVGIDPNIGLTAILISAVAVIIGGVGIFEAAALGGLLLGLVQNLVIWKISARWIEVLTFVILIIFLLTRPQGILGKRRRLEEV